jgi:porin
MHSNAQQLRSALAIALISLCGGAARAYDVNEQLSINLLLAGAGQCQEVTGGGDEQNGCRGAVPVRPEIFFNPTKQDQFFVKFGFAAGNGLNPVSPFALSPWAADLEADVRNINGRDRSYLLEAWYAHTFRFSDTNEVQVTGGIIDPAFYVNENAYANDEYTQFMNEAFVNSRNAFLPAYDVGGALVWKIDRLTLSGLGMNVGENDDGNNFNWFGVEADYNLQTPWGEGNYRVMYVGTSRAFLAPAAGLDPEPNPDLDPALDLDSAAEPDPTDKEHLSSLLLSFDQEFGKIVGAFLRLGWQREDALVDYQADYSGGFDFKGAGWGRENDNIGIGYAYLEGGSGELARTNAVEGYYRLAFNDTLALTADVQYMKDKYRTGDVIDGWVFSLRAVAEF